MKALFVDFHCHPALKPFGKSFGTQEIGSNSLDANKGRSIWHYSPPHLIDKAFQAWVGICKYTQADCKSLLRGNSRLVCASLYPLERGFFRNKLGENCTNENINAFITSVGKERVESIQNIKNYFEDLQREYGFYKQLEGQRIEIDGIETTYRIVRNYAELEAYERSGENDNSIFFIMTIEGLHSLNENIDAEPNEASFLANVRTVKSWDYPPFFVTFAHHFYNHLCGHSKSLFDLVGKVDDQADGLGEGFSELGRKVLYETLSSGNGRRIYIDIKHMSPKARQEYFEILRSEYSDQQIPVIASHAAANGLKSVDQPVPGNDALSNLMLAEPINFYDDEIIMVARTGGIYGLQLDERRLASKAALKAIKHSIRVNEIRHYRSALLWNQVQYVAELLDKSGLPAWDCMGIGSDFDATIDPLNGFLTAEHLPILQSYLERHAFNYMEGAGKKLRPENQISASEIVNRIFSENGRRFIQRWF